MVMLLIEKLYIGRNGDISLTMSLINYVTASAIP